jgi:hypothetical protein
MTNHTPGPWEVKRLVSSPFHVWVKAADYTVVCVGQSRTRDNCESVMADARLIAAAPDLLEALVVAMDWLGDKGVTADHPEMRKLMAVRARAEGRS